MTERLKERYRNLEYVLRRDEDTEGYAITAEDNPGCGDDVLLYLKTEDGRITGGRFGGDCCPVCAVSADMMIGAVLGKTIEEARKTAEDFKQFLDGKAVGRKTGEITPEFVLIELEGIKSRRECAELPWKALRRAIAYAEKAGREK